MGIEYTSGKGKISSAVMAFQKRLETATVYLLKYLGESLVKYAKEQHNYTDQSGNLTNSMGYVIVQNSTPIHFGGLNQPGEGADAGLKVAMKLAAETPSSFSLIIVAGMNYAAYVEAKGYNVILPAELKAKAEFPAAMSKLATKAKAKANELFGDII
ncbi:hypothetical protein M2451_002557 [Dysgonomonas sp. PFB1-18]|uniref:hypothetical protein n=1 Tax=unclassified Dysgonomonas TaxID=2630389 RepID=UPI002474DC1F|nr:MULTISPECIES: hypothetical protein [unclassified Dysgonomonas]MDH6308038.1 hypothetical protein [Dysgonomonas sp. PF1-14]MDH6339577.1 hypothetical protein [Dysgonomonas sp. PF1-16]MDH6381228.1 hypothetical protein [Dysgonomonas sp. PFB1-18]MDH6398440.1 hypothetical protein [Dysgonomonas sp. PF1-23]